MKLSIVTAVIVIIVAVGASAALYYANMPSPPSKMIKLREATFGTDMPYLTNSVDFLAKDLGFYEKEGLDFEITGLASTPLVLNALKAGQVDISGMSGSTALKLDATGDMATVVFVSYTGHGSPSVSVVVGKKNIASIQDLKGKKIGVGAIGGADQVTTIPILRAYGLDPDKDIQWIAIGSPAARITALMSGQIDAVTTSIMTWIPISGDPNLKIIINGEEYSKILPSVGGTITTVDFMKKNPEAIQKYTRAIIKASRYFAENKDAWIDAVLKRRPDLTRENVSKVYDFVRPGWAVNGGINLDDYNKAFDSWYQLPEFKDVPKVTPSSWVNTQFIDQVLKEIGVYKDRNIDDPGRSISGLMQVTVPLAKEADR
ncbi:MAG: hypothetical protein A3K61_07930 [Thaumarchaeota archaeon RBG_16_49_8]|nr:MAG: hypothetical protein A3K61_07930 [Thaumarchaeota archaeon RBG_16_49_8]